MTTNRCLPFSLLWNEDGTPQEIADMTMANLIRVVLPLHGLIRWLENTHFRTLRDGEKAGAARRVDDDDLNSEDLIKGIEESYQTRANASKVDTDESCPGCGEIDWWRTPEGIVCGTCKLPCWWDLREAKEQRK